MLIGSQSSVYIFCTYKTLTFGENHALDPDPHLFQNPDPNPREMDEDQNSSFLYSWVRIWILQLIDIGSILPLSLYFKIFAMFANFSCGLLILINS